MSGKETIEKYFEVRELGKALDTIICKRCGRVWKWPSERELSAGAILELLNHAGEHDDDVQ